MVVLLVLLVPIGAGIMSAAGCSNGTTPVCDDAGSCLILAPSDDMNPVSDGGTEAGEDGPTE